MTRADRLTVAFIGCCYKGDMYSHNCYSFVRSVRASENIAVDFITSNCGCFSSTHHFGLTRDELADKQIIPIRVPYIGPDPNRKPSAMKCLAFNMFQVHVPLEIFRGLRFFSRAKHADIIHYDQVFKAFGFLGLFTVIALSRVFHIPVVETVHEIDPVQDRHRWMNYVYNHCAKVFVYSRGMANQLTRLGVKPEAIGIIRYGATIPALLARTKTQYIFFGGHNILRGKGYPEVLDALLILKNQGNPIRLFIYAGNGCNGLGEAKTMSQVRGVSDMIEWSEFMFGDELITAYQKSKVCLIPFTSGSGRHPVTCAMASGIPVIATRAVDLPEYLGDLGIYIEPDGKSLAAAVMAIEEPLAKAAQLEAELRAKAIAELDFAGIAEEVIALYKQVRVRSAVGL